MSDNRPKVHVPHEQANRVVYLRRDEMMNPRGKPKSTRCATCPCRTVNDGLVTGRGEEWDVFFRAETREAVWNGTWDQDDPDSALSNGGVNFCHQQHKYPCAGTLVLQQRELLRFLRYAVEHSGNKRKALRAYEAARPHGLTAKGLRIAANKMGCRVAELLTMPLTEAEALMHPAIHDRRIGHEDVDR